MRNIHSSTKGIQRGCARVREESHSSCRASHAPATCTPADRPGYIGHRRTQTYPNPTLILSITQSTRAYPLTLRQFRCSRTAPRG
eukprot:312555-Amorphochlora_amoeboformis.AAC.1